MPTHALARESPERCDFPLLCPPCDMLGPFSLPHPPPLRRSAFKGLGVAIIVFMTLYIAWIFFLVVYTGLLVACVAVN